MDQPINPLLLFGVRPDSTAQEISSFENQEPEELMEEPLDLETEESEREQAIRRGYISQTYSHRDPRFKDESRISDFTYAGLEMMPVRCYTCGKVFWQGEIEDLLKSGVSVRETMDRLGYKRICCRSRILSSPSIVQLQKDLILQNRIGQQLENLTLVQTTPFNTAFETQTGGMQIVEDVPPDVREANICFDEFDEFEVEEETGAIDAYDFAMRQLGTQKCMQGAI